MAVVEIVLCLQTFATATFEVSVDIEQKSQTINVPRCIELTGCNIGFFLVELIGLIVISKK